MGTQPTADLVFRGGVVRTMDPLGTVANAVAVGDGRVLAVGEQAARELSSTETEVVDLAGRAVLPGFQDAHVHPIYAGLQRLRCDLSGGANAAECLRRIGDYARTHPTTWILGGGWDSAWFPNGSPSREALDSVTGDRPAYLINQDHHDAWVNTAALRRAGVDRDTPDPPDGRVARDAEGFPSGTLHEGATALVAAVLPPTSTREYLDGLLEGQRELHAHGVTAWQDAIVGPYLGYDDTLPIYQDAEQRGLLTGHVRAALWWDRHRGEEQVADLLWRRARAAGPRMRAETVKIMQDGVCENHSAALLRPYAGGTRDGASYVPPDTLPRVVSRLDAEGFQVHFHAVGDRAVREALDALAHARTRNGTWDSRHQIAHLQLVHPDDLSRFRELGVLANVQPRWAVHDAPMRELTVPYLGPERARRQYPLRSLRDAGAMLAAGSDWPVSEVSPLLGIHVAVNRAEPGGGEPFLPEQGLPVHDALAAYTTGSARANRLDDRTGSLEPGKDADLVILDEDPCAVARMDLAEIRVDLTLVGGQVVYQR